MTEVERTGNSSPSWLDEAHRRADSSEESAWAAWHGGEVKPRAELSAASLTAVITFGWLTSRGAIDVSSNPLQGLMLGGAFPVPLFTHALLACTSWLDPPLGIVLLNVTTRLLGALAAAGVTALAVNATRRVGTAGEAWICGLLAGIVFMLSHDVTSAFTSAWPGAITVTCAIWGIAVLSRAAQRRTHAGRWLIVGSALCAAAVANHAFFAWLAIPVIVVAFLAWRRQALALSAAVGALLIWVGMVSLPLIHSLFIQGEQANIFLGRVLRSPYPAIAELAPNWDTLLRLGNQFHPLVWILALAAVLLVVQRHARPATLAAVVLVLIAGPLAPAMMNQFDRGAFPRDTIALDVMALVGFTIVFGLGLAASMQVVFRNAHSLGYRSAMAVLVLAVVALHQWTMAPDRRSDLSGAFAQTMLDGCPRQSILIVRDPTIAGMLTATQHAYAHRLDVRIVPAGVLLNSAARQYYRQVHPDGIHIDTAYDTREHATAWQQERPILANTLLNAAYDSSIRRDALNELILWEFVRDNLSARPIAFAGVDAGWLHARAEINGLVQVYPRVEAPLTNSIEAWLALKAANSDVLRDPELSGAITQVLLSLSATRRAQNQGEEATRLAELATQYGKGDARAWIALARAAARQGSREEAQVFSTTGLRIGGVNAMEVTDMLVRDFDAYELVSMYQAKLVEKSIEPSDREARQQMAADLWVFDEIAVLDEFMEFELALEAPSAPNLYEVAATKAQLGDFAAARVHLLDAIALAPDDVAGHLAEDGRFVLLQLDHQPSPHQSSL